MRMTALTALLVISAFACGGGSNGGDDDDVPTDGPGGNTDGPNTQPDGPVNPTSPIGTTCTPDAADPVGQGSCPAGFSCLNLMGATNPWCSKTCAGIDDTSCATGYDGPGKAACLLTAGPQGGPTQNFCGVICEDTTAEGNFCPECNGTCPGAMACTGPITNNNPPPATLGNACE